jgi:hypothetical protein
MKARKRETEINELPKDLEEEEFELASEDDFNEHPPADIVAFNELRSCADLVRMEKAGQLEIQPEFQRDVVWTRAAQSRFIDSLIKQLPIPSMCISLDYRTNKRLVVDGLQRMSSILKFLDDPSWQVSSLSDIDTRVSGRRVEYIKNTYPDIYDRVQNLTIPITVLRCDYSKKNHMRFLFTIFHRLNTGGNKLTNQEIRNCIFSGQFNDLLKELAKSKEFRHLFGLKKNQSYRYAYEELILRFFTFVDGFNDYDGRFANYLNEYMQWASEADEDYEAFLTSKRDLFNRTITQLHDKIQDGAPLPKLSKATVEAILVGIGANIEHVESLPPAKARKLLDVLRKSDEFHPSELKNALTSKQKLVERLNKAVEVFGP